MLLHLLLHNVRLIDLLPCLFFLKKKSFKLVASTPVKSGAGPLVSNSATSEALGDINPENVPANMKVEGQDWFAL